MHSNRLMARQETLPAFRIVAPVGVAVVLAAILSGGRAAAAPVTLMATQAPSPASSFSLAFPAEYGAPSYAPISQTDFSLEINAAAATARFTDYEQFVTPLTLPGPVSTGDIHVVVQPDSSHGTLNVLTGEFTTHEVYDVYFDGDLSAYGFYDSVPVPSTSVGTVKVSALTGGEVHMAWEGTYMLYNPYDPANPIPIRYTCEVHSTFAPEPVTLLELALIPNIINLHLSPKLERVLLNQLNLALTHVSWGESELAASSLETFIHSVNLQRGRGISNEDADALLSDADGTILLLENGLFNESD